MSRDNTAERLDRRSILKLCAGGSGTLLAGCTGLSDDSNGGDTEGGGSNTTDDGDNNQNSGSGNSGTDLSIAGLWVEQNKMDKVAPWGGWEFADGLNSNGNFNARVVGGSQICGGTDCPPKVRNNVVPIAETSAANSTSQFPALDVLLLPYTYPAETLQSMPYVFSKQETWERFWVPLAKEYGVLPLFFTTPLQRYVGIGTSYNEKEGGRRLAVPSDVENIDMRRAANRSSAIAISEWGLNPVQIGYGDAVQGLQTGVVQAIDNGVAVDVAFGMGDSTAQAIMNQWNINTEIVWANVSWLKGLSSDQQETIAQESKKVFNKMVGLADEVHTERCGAHTENPPSGSAYAKNNIKPSILNEQELQQWIDPVHPLENSDLYSEIFADATSLIGEDGQEFHQYLWDSARSSEIPSQQDFEPESWWIDHMSKL
jgi:TRAP-type C4-dicarboxylate transport system substrate-binding protein